jgi:hypothetical protein
MTALFWMLVLGCSAGDEVLTETDDDAVDSLPLGGQETGEDWVEPVAPWASSEPDLVLALIGDYGMDNDAEAAVAALVDSWEPDFVLTAGDNNYPMGEAGTIDANIGQYYQQYIYPYTGAYGVGAEVNAFYPCPGNHDWYGKDEITPYTEYFELPGNERYYEVALGAEGLLDLFCVDSDNHEPDGNSSDSVQAAWLADALETSDATWRLVTLHHSPYSSGVHQDEDKLKWPYGEWGAQVVMGGHDHNYERIVENDTLYTVNGAGGAGLRSVQPHTTGTQVWDVSYNGAQRIRVFGDWLVAEFLGTGGELIDQVFVHAEHSLDASSYLVSPGAAWRYLDSGEAPDSDWTSLAFDDSGWSEGGTPMGYGNSGHVTTLDDGEDASDRPISTWFRHSFQVADPSDRSQQTLHLRRDDGAVVYLNGSEVLRSNLPSESDAGTLAEEEITGTEEQLFHAESVPLDLLEGGENILAVEVHQASADSDDLTFELRLEVEGGDELVSSGAEWAWSTVGMEDWNRADVDLSDWPRGPSPLGYGLGGEATETSTGALTTWFRHEFEVTNPSDTEMLLLQLKRDDGARVFLNGVEVLRSNLPEGEVDAETLAHTAVDGIWQTVWQSSHLLPSLLRRGTNVIGVEVHQISAEDTDLGMDLKLIRR